MLPVISTTAFGHFPASEQLIVLRQFGFLQIQADLDHFSSRLPARLMKASAAGADVSIIAVHLPRAALALDDARRALDIAYELGARVAVTHSPPDSSAMHALCDAATERGVVVAFEIDSSAGATSASLIESLSALGPEHGRHGLCLDTSRWRPPETEFTSLRPHLRWLEVSDQQGERIHTPPTLDDLALRRLVSGLNMPYVCYEVVPVGIPGDAQLLSILSEINVWHRGGGQTNYEHLVTP